MNDVMEALGLSASSNSDVFLFCAIFSFAVVTVLWVVGLLSAAGQNTAVALGTRAAQRLLAQHPTPVRRTGTPVRPLLRRSYT